MSGRDLLRKGLEALQLPFTEVQLEQLNNYYEELSFWNPSHKLVAAEGAELITRHIMDVLTPLKELRQRFPVLEMPECSIVDIGSGGGLPGIPLAVMLDQLRMVLIERSGRRAGFLRNCVVMTGLSDRVAVYEGDVKEYAASLRSLAGGLFDAVTCRAVMSISDLYQLVEPLRKKESFVFLYKGMTDRAEAELHELRISGRMQKGEGSELIMLENPENPGHERCIVVLEQK